MTEQSRAPAISPLLAGAERARRPTGPVVGIVVALVCLLVGQLLAGFALIPLFGADPVELLTGRMGLATQQATMLSFGGAVLLLWLWMAGKERRPFGSIGFTTGGRPLTHLALGAVVAAVLVSIPVLLGLLSGASTSGAARAGIGVVLVALTGFAVQATTEEVVTRGYLLQVTFRRWGLVAAVLVQAAVFAALHGVNMHFSWVALVNIALIGVLLALWALAEGGLWGVCAFHVVWNWLQGNVYGIPVSGMDLQATLLRTVPVPGSEDLLTGGGFGVEGSLVTTAVLLAGAVVAHIAFRRARS
ncbi:CPBP family intramembrane metalloprotease [Saccharopolyspora sp. HNM0983]|uniref:CPBP family intramembrane metalloprotease n=1 Tax=Saccharopolyspora montiporae TaxID=2781240 RepID=A0A929BAX1_9PSEU|nr:type II CAAX endopeptidase family protein [Saccharopolyspora sp. HNM0983]MBE9374232.1 CPBP family intramembrane metalloprotease [Saccharopolyspora sp. HNM0983]